MKFNMELIYCNFIINMIQYKCCRIMPAGRTRYADYAISLSMIRNDGRSINTAVGSAQAVFHRRERDSMAMLSKVR